MKFSRPTSRPHTRAESLARRARPLVLLGVASCLGLTLIAPATSASAEATGPLVTVATMTQTPSGPAVEETRVPANEVAETIAEAKADPDTLAVSTPVRTHAAEIDEVAAVDAWNLKQVNVEQAWGSTRGAGVTVAVLDTGVAAAHPDLAGRVLPGYDTIMGRVETSTDTHGHGTHVAGIVAATAGNRLGSAGVAPLSSILPVRVLDASGSGWSTDLANGILWATNHGAGVINMSLGGTADSLVAEAIEYAIAHGVVVVAAAGNEALEGNAVSYPGAYPGVLAVAATGRFGTRASFSNTGTYVDLAAPGVSILSTSYTGGFVTKSGTSMAAPHVAAIAAMVKAAKPGIVPSEVEAVLKGTARDTGPAGPDALYGAGIVDASAAVCSVAGPCAPLVVTPPAPRVFLDEGWNIKIRTNWAHIPVRGTVRRGEFASPGELVSVESYVRGKKVATWTTRTNSVGRFAFSVSTARNMKLWVQAAGGVNAEEISVTIAPRLKVRSPYRGRLEVTTTGTAPQWVRAEHYEAGRWVLRRWAHVDAAHKRVVLKVGRGGYWRAVAVRNLDLDPSHSSAVWVRQPARR